MHRKERKRKHYLLSVTIGQEFCCIVCTYFTSFRAFYKLIEKAGADQALACGYKRKCLTQNLNTILLGFSVTFHYPPCFSKNSHLLFSKLELTAKEELGQVGGTDRPTQYRSLYATGGNQISRQ